MTDTTQFREVRTASNRVAFECHTAVWNCDGQHVAISAPTLAILEKLWERITGEKFSRTVGANHTYIVKFEDRGDKSLLDDRLTRCERAGNVVSFVNPSLAERDSLALHFTTLREQGHAVLADEIREHDKSRTEIRIHHFLNCRRCAKGAA